MTTPSLMLLDTYGLVYRAFFAMPPLSTSGGTPINAVLGFVNMLNRIIAQEKPTHVIAAFDKGRPAARLELYGEYKAQRSAMPDELRAQFPLVRRVLATFGIPIAEIDGEEADDVIATLAHRAGLEGKATVVVTGDLDLLQIADETTTILRTRKGISELDRFDPAAVRERFDLDPGQLADYRGLKGDPSDNLPGVPGIGEKTASKLIKLAGTLDNLVAHPELAGTSKLQKLIEERGGEAQLFRDVSMIRRDLNVHIDWHASRFDAPKNDELYTLYAELEFKGLLAKLQPPSSGMPLFENARSLRGAYTSYVPAVDPPEFVRLAGDLQALAKSERLAFAVIGDAIGVSGAAGSGISFGAGALDYADVRSSFETLWRGAVPATAYDAKRVLRVAATHGLPVRAFDDDPMVGAHLLETGRTFFYAADAAALLLGVPIDDDAAAHADAALQMTVPARERLEERDQLALYSEIEVPLAPVLAKMEIAGVAVDTRELHVMAAELDEALAGLQRKVHDFAGEEFNIGSPQQLGNVLFGKLQIPSGKKNKTGWATGVEVLQGLAREYPICALVLDWREISKLKNTYVDVIPTLVDADGRLRTAFNQTATATGRLSSTNPNLQNIPVRGELGRRIRKAFVAPPGRVLLAADYSQIELRLMAHLSGDEAMRRAFEDGQDIHDFTAHQIFDVPAGQKADANQRRIAKSVNFGLLYGMSDFGLAQRLEIGRAEAKAMTQAYFARFPSVRAYIDRTLEEGRQNGYVSTLFKRRRYMPGLTSGNYMLRSAAEREATNAPLQGSAADLMKLAMVRLDRALEREGIDATMLLQIHDELIFEVPVERLQAAARLVRAEMESAAQLSVPLEVTLKSGVNWYEVQELEVENV